MAAHEPTADGDAVHHEHLHRTAYELTESIPVGTYTMVLPPGGGMGRFSFMSTRFLELTGLDREAAAADPFQAFACVHPDDHAEWVRRNAEVFANKLPFFGECRIIVRGEVRWITAESSPRDLPDGSTVWEGVLIDITDRKRAEEALMAANRARELAAEAHRRELEHKLRVSLAAAAIAHEIDQPLATILLQSKTVDKPGEAVDALAVVAREAERVVATIDRMRKLLRSVQTEHAAVDLALVVQRSLLMIEDAARAAGVAVESAGLERPVVVSGDEVQLQIAAGNLLRNAIEALRDRAAGRRRIRVEVVESAADVELVVGDSGPGWSGAERVGAPLATTKPEGTGVGLFVVRTVVENHGGSVAFRTSPLGGAEVRCRLPRAVAATRNA